MFDFLKDLGAKTGQKFESVSIFHEDTAFGTDSAKVQEQLAKESGIKVLEKITYKAQTTSLTSEVQRLKAANADVLMPSSYTSDTFLLLRTAKELDYNPKLIVAQNAGFTDPTFLSTMGKEAEGCDHALALQLGSRRPHSPAEQGQRDLQEAFERPRSVGRAGARLHGLHDAARRLQPGRLDGSREAARGAGRHRHPARPADRALPRRQVRRQRPEQLVRPILMQVQKGKYCTIYPFELAACQLLFPTPTWAEKAKM